MLILRSLKQEERNKRGRHILPLFSLFIPRDSFWWWEQGLHNKQLHTRTHTRVSNPGNQWNSMRMFWKRRNLPGTTDRPETVKGIFHLKESLNSTRKMLLYACSNGGTCLLMSLTYSYTFCFWELRMHLVTSETFTFTSSLCSKSSEVVKLTKES